MSNHKFLGGTLRKIWSTETQEVRDHLLRLDAESRRMRFAHTVADSFIEDYVERLSPDTSIMYGYFDRGVLAGTAELRKLADDWAPDAEAAFSVEGAYREKGIGSELMGRIIRAARNRGVRHLYMSCLAENAAMQKIAKKHEASLRFEYGEVVGDIVPAQPDYVSVMAEAVDDRVSYLMAVLDLSKRQARVA
ncbi:MAG: GNAT family N-acetyltransferase [Pseudomonadota bacterium]